MHTDTEVLWPQFLFRVLIWDLGINRGRAGAGSSGMHNEVISLKVYYGWSSPLPLDKSMLVFEIQYTSGNHFRTALLTSLLGKTSVVGGWRVFATRIQAICLFVHLFILLVTHHSFTKVFAHFPTPGALPAETKALEVQHKPKPDSVCPDYTKRWACSLFHR